MKMENYGGQVQSNQPFNFWQPHTPFSQAPSSQSFVRYHPPKERKLVCVTSGNSYLGAHLAEELLIRGYLVRVTVQNPEDRDDFAERNEMRGLESVVAAKMDNLGSLCTAFRGCHAVFHTSSFIDPNGLTGYSERMAALEAQGAKNVVEACGLVANVRMCIFTSSMLASIWQRDGVAGVLDERHWSDEHFCREQKLWLALGKTMAEKAAWKKSAEAKVQLASICPALLTGAVASLISVTIPYLKGIEVMLSRGILATVDVDAVVRAHICVFEEMDRGARGRYLCFNRVIGRAEDLQQVEQTLQMCGASMRGEILPQEQELVEGCCNPSNAKLAQLMSSACKRPSYYEGK